jgi:serine/threonine protein kinase
MKVKLIDLGNAVPIDRTNIYYDDFEVQSIHYRAPEVLLGLPFTSSIDIFSLGLILAELLLPHADPPAPTTRSRQSSFPTSPPQSHSPPPLHSVPLLSTFTLNRRAFIEQMTRLFGPLPSIYHTAKFWSHEFIEFGVGASLSQRLEGEGVEPVLVDFIMRLVHLDPTRRVSAREALRHEWIVGPMLGYWAVLGMEWKEPEMPALWQRLGDVTPTADIEREGQDIIQQATIEMPAKGFVREKSVEGAKRSVYVESDSSTSDRRLQIDSGKRFAPLYDFSATQDSEEEDLDEVSQILYSGSSPTKPLPFIDTQSLEIQSKPSFSVDTEEPEVLPIRWS